MTTTPTQRAREFVEADLSDALGHLRDAATLLPKTSLADTTKLRAEIDVATEAAATAHATFRALLQADPREEGGR